MIVHRSQLYRPPSICYEFGNPRSTGQLMDAFVYCWRCWWGSLSDFVSPFWRNKLINPRRKPNKRCNEGSIFNFFTKNSLLSSSLWSAQFWLIYEWTNFIRQINSSASCSMRISSYLSLTPRLTSWIYMVMGAYRYFLKIYVSDLCLIKMPHTR